MLQTRRLQPTQVQERQIKNNKFNSSIDDDIHQQYKCSNNIGTNSNTISTRNVEKEEAQVHYYYNDTSNEAMRTRTRTRTSARTTTQNHPRQPFDSKPFYTKVKPHITTQKRVRYVHLVEPSNTKAMPKDEKMIVWDGPIVYRDHDSSTSGRRRGAGGGGEEDGKQRSDYRHGNHDHNEEGILEDGKAKEIIMNLNKKSKTKTRTVSTEKKKAILSLNPIFHDTFTSPTSTD